jgi:hypothetical protein
MPDDTAEDAASATVDRLQPLDFLGDQDQPAPALKQQHLPSALFPFVSDTAERMGVDAASVALSCIVACASVLTDGWRRHGEAMRLYKQREKEAKADTSGETPAPVYPRLD